MKAHLLLAAGLALGVAFLVAGAAPAALIAAQSVCDRWVVGISGRDLGDCSESTHPCRTIQYAIDQAAENDRVCIADESLLPGPTIYAEGIRIARTLTLDGKWEAACVSRSDLGQSMLDCSFAPVACDPQRVVLDAQGAGRTVTIRGQITPTIDCFTITGGDAAGLGGDPQPAVDNDAGGGVYSQDAAPLIINNIITGNHGCTMCPATNGRGGGIYLLNAPQSAVVSGNRIENNVADESTWGQGGGVMLRDSDAQVLDNTIQNNRAGYAAGDGGGISVQGGMPTIRRNQILSNVASETVAGNGGGIFAWYTASVTIEDNLIGNNLALNGAAQEGLQGRGGGIFFRGAPGTRAIIRDNTLTSNAASRLESGQGGGIYIEDLDTTSIVDGNTLERNSAGDTGGEGGGYYVQDSSLTMVGGLVDGNYASTGGEGYGGGLYLVRSSVLVSNTVVSNNIAGGVGGFGRGGGAYITSTVASLVGNRFAANQAARDEPWPGRGGAVAILNSPGSLFQNNLFDGNQAPVHGGAVFLVDSDGVTFRSNAFVRNAALQGGGAYVLYSDGVAFEANTLTANTSSSGAAIYLYAAATRLDHNLVADNELTADSGQGAIQIEGSQARLRHNTIAHNPNASGIRVTSSWGGSGQAILINTVVVSNTVGISVAAGSVATLADTLWGTGRWANGRNYGGTGTVVNAGPTYMGNPGFLDPGTGNYHISANSAALDRGINTGLEFDIDLQPRPYRIPDLGADEYWPPGAPARLPTAP